MRVGNVKTAVVIALLIVVASIACHDYFVQVENVKLKVNYEAATRLVQELKNQNKGLLENYSKILSAHETLLQEFKTLNQSYTTLSQNYTLLIEQYQRVLTEYVRLTIDYASLNLTYNRLFQNYTSLENQTIELKGRYEHLLDAYASLNSTYVKLFKNYMDLEQQMAELRSRYEHLSDAYVSLNLTYMELSQNYTNLEQQTIELERKYEYISKVYASLNLTYTKLLQNYTELEQQAYELKSKYENLSSAYRLLLANYSEIKSQLEGLYFAVYKPLLSNEIETPSINELRSWLEKDETDKISYTYPDFVCGDFAVMLSIHAKLNHWDMGVVAVLGTKADGSKFNHAFNAIRCKEGLVYVEPQNDQIFYGPIREGQWYYHPGFGLIHVDLFIVVVLYQPPLE